LIGMVIFVVGSVGHLQKTKEDDVEFEEPQYRVVGLDQPDMGPQEINGMSGNFAEGEG
jgi:hypothetical protein